MTYTTEEKENNIMTHHDTEHIESLYEDGYDTQSISEVMEHSIEWVKNRR